ncbi:hypothetical protein CN514_12335 [Bacillus sp. AFS001701]|uniref:HNH endonuclease n=1 Tax=Bacillus sp. AFS001701 TaxID=2033480 RepID=UPI000BF256EF|nr:HNH endonuclease signature motif containing protein [Bacillus sp. AFS001701]PET65152.1 hypothetical protein CN514_12335 [Bacillus sp. AFS001701]
MIVSKIAKVKWNAKNKKRFEKLDYEYTKMGEEFHVKIEHLSRGSTGMINVKCDYCGYEYPIMYQTYIYIHRKTISQKDCCNNQDCTNMKIMESNIIKYGIKHHIKVASVQEKVKETLKGKYGVKNVFQLESVKEKSKETNLKRYGTEFYVQTEVYKKRVRAISLEKYGYESHMQHPKYREMFSGEKSPVWKGGVTYHRVERATSEYRNWRKAVFSRDKYRCQCCGAKQGEVDFCVELHAHHIVNWKDSIGLRYHINNGITFCYDCHMKFHTIYGKRGNSISQVNEFIASVEVIRKKENI